MRERALAEAADGADALLPPVTALRDVALAVATAVAKQAVADGLATVETDDWRGRIAAMMWTPAYAAAD